MVRGKRIHATWLGLLAAVLGLAGSALADTYVSDTLGTATTWTKANSPYHVTGAITVPTGAMLMIEPGVDVLFDADVQFVVQGSILAQGTKADSIRFLPGTAAEWGGIRISGGSSMNSLAYVRISGGKAEGTRPDNFGGAMYVSGAGTYVSLQHVVMTRNVAAGSSYGGGLCLEYGAVATADLCRFSRNTAGQGGGICVNETAGLTLSRCFITRNTSTTYGGGMFVSSNASASLTNCTLYANAGNLGGAVDVAYGGSVAFRNCIVWGNKPSDLYSEPTNPMGTLAATYTDLQSTLAGTGNISLYPMFVDTAAGNLSLQTGSPCIDAGDPMSPQDPDGTRADMGAIPFKAAPPPGQVEVPNLVGLSIAQAVQQVRALGLALNYVQVYESNDPTQWEKVTYQTPSPGAVVATGTVIAFQAGRQPGPIHVTFLTPKDGALFQPTDTIRVAVDQPFSWSASYPAGTMSMNDLWFQLWPLGQTWSQWFGAQPVAASDDAKSFAFVAADMNGDGRPEGIEPGNVYVLQAYVRPTDMPSVTTYFTTGAPIPGGELVGNAIFPAATVGQTLDRMRSRIWLEPDMPFGDGQPTVTIGKPADATSQLSFQPVPGIGLVPITSIDPSGTFPYRMKPVAPGTYGLYAQARLYRDDHYGRFYFAMRDADQDLVADKIIVGGGPIQGMDLPLGLSPLGITQGDVYFDTVATTFRFDVGGPPTEGSAPDLVLTTPGQYGYDIIAGRPGVLIAFLGQRWSLGTALDQAVPRTPNIPALGDSAWGTDAYALTNGYFNDMVFAVHTPEGKYGLFAVTWPNEGGMGKPVRAVDGTVARPARPANDAEAARTAQQQNFSLYILWAYQPNGSANFGPPAPREMVMPNLVGMNADSAQALLRRLGEFSVNIGYESTVDPRLVGMVKDQMPTAGSLVWSGGGYVHLVVGAPPAVAVHVMSMSPRDGSVNVGVPVDGDSVLVTMTIALSRPIELITRWNDGRQTTMPNIDVMVMPPTDAEPAYQWNATRDTIRVAGRLKAGIVYDYIVTSHDNDGIGAEIPDGEMVLGTFSTGPTLAGAQLSGSFSLPNAAVPFKAAFLLTSPPYSPSLDDFRPFRLGIVGDGSYSVKGVAPGRYWLIGIGFDPATFDRPGTMPDYYFGIYDPEGDGIPNPIDVGADAILGGLNLKLERPNFALFGNFAVVATSPNPLDANVPIETRLEVRFNDRLQLDGQGRPDVEAFLFPAVGPSVRLDSTTVTLNGDSSGVSWPVTLAPNQAYQLGIMKATGIVDESPAELSVPVVVPFTTGGAMPTGKLSVDIRLASGASPSATGYFAGLLKSSPEAADPKTWDIAWLAFSQTGRVELRLVPGGTYYVVAGTPGDVLSPAAYTVSGVPQAVTIVEGQPAQVVAITLEPGLSGIVATYPARNAVNVPLSTRLAITFEEPLPVDESGGGIMLFPEPPAMGPDSISADRRTLYKRVQLAGNTSYQVFLIGNQKLPMHYGFTTGPSMPTSIVAGQLRFSLPFLTGTAAKPAATGSDGLPMVVALMTELPATAAVEGTPRGLVRVAFTMTNDFIVSSVPPGDYYLLATEAGDATTVKVVGFFDKNDDGVPDKIHVAPDASVLGLDVVVDQFFGWPRLVSASPSMFQTNVPAGQDTALLLVFSSDLDTMETHGVGDVRLFPSPPSGPISRESFRVWHDEDANLWFARAPVRFAPNTTYNLWVFDMGSTRGPNTGPVSYAFTTGAAMPTGQVVGQVTIPPLAGGGLGDQGAMVFVAPQPGIPDLTGPRPDSAIAAVTALALIDVQGKFRLRCVQDGTWYPTAIVFRAQGEADAPPAVIDVGQPDVNGDGIGDAVVLGPASRRVEVTIPIAQRLTRQRVLAFTPADGATGVPAGTPVPITIRFSQPIFDPSGAPLAEIKPLVLPRPLEQGEVQQGADANTLTFTATLAQNTTYQIIVFIPDIGKGFASLFTTSAAFPGGRVSGRVDIAASMTTPPAFTLVTLVRKPPTSPDVMDWDLVRIVQTLDGRYSFGNLPDTTYYVVAFGFLPSSDHMVTSSLQPNSLAIKGGAAVGDANVRLGEVAGAMPPQVMKFDVAIGHLKPQLPTGTIDLYVPIINAVIVDPNGTYTVKSVTVTMPGGTVVPITPSPDGRYTLALAPTMSFTGGTFTITATDTGDATGSATDDVGAMAVGTPKLIEPADNAQSVGLAPRLDWADLPGAAGYKVQLTTHSPINLLDWQRGIADFLDPTDAVISYLDAPTFTSDLRVPAGLLKPNTTYYWAVGAMDNADDIDHIAVSAVYSFTTGSEAQVVDATPPVLVKRPEVLHVDTQSITIGWVTDEQSDSRVFYGLAATSIGDSAVDMQMTTVHAVTIGNLTSGTEYFLAIASTDRAGHRLYVPLDFSAVTARDVDRDPPSFVAGPVAEGIDTNRVTIKWVTDEATRGFVTLTSAGGDTTVRDDRLLKGHDLAIVGLKPGTRYAFAVGAVDAAGNGPTAVAGHPFTTATAPDRTPPRVLIGPAVVASEGGALVSWTADEPHVAHVVVRNLVEQLVAEAWSDAPSMVQVVRVTGLTSDTEYKAIVQMTDANGNGITLRPRSFRTLAARDTIPPRIIVPPSVSYRADTRIMLEWQTDEPADGRVRIYASDQLVGSFGDGALVRAHRFVVTKLAAGQSYRFSVSSTDAAGNTVTWPSATPALGRIARAAGRSSSTFATSTTPDVTAPQLVGGPTVLSRTASTLTINWSTDEVANSVVYFGEAATGKLTRLTAETLPNTVTLTDNVTDHSVTITNLKPASTYAYQVSSTDPAGNSGASSEIANTNTLAEEDLTPPDFVEAPAVSGRTDTRLTIHWTTDEPSDSRISYRVSGSSGSSLEMAVPDLVIDHAVTVTNLAPLTNYELTVSSSDLIGNGPTTTVIVAQTQAAADITRPAITAGPSVTTDATQARIAWATNEPSDSWVEYGQTQALGTVVSKPALATAHEVVLTSLLPSVTYYFGMASSDASGNITDSTSASFTWTTLAAADTTPPAKVTGVAAVVGAYAVRLAWAANTESDLAGYSVERAVGGGSFTKIANQLSLVTYTDNGVTIGQAYSYRVRAEDKSSNHNTSVPSDTILVTPTANDAPGKPVPFQHDTTVSAKPILTVQNAAANSRAIARYSFIVALDSALTQIVTTASTVTPGTATTAWQLSFRLDNTVRYWWGARAVDMEGFAGPLSKITNFVVDQTKVPQAVRLASFAAEAGARHVTVSWALAQGSSSSVFHIWRAAGDGEFVRMTTRPVDGPGPQYRYVDAGVVVGQTYRYRLEAVEPSGHSTSFGPVSVAVALPQQVVLDQNVPNPFNPSTRIAYQVPMQAQVRLIVYNVLGQEVRVLASGLHAPGYYQRVWDGLTDIGGPAASGIYFARLEVLRQEGSAAGRPEVRVIRMLMVR